jgi:hypothetical protein
MVMAALTLGLAVRLALENRELEKLLPATSASTLLFLAASLTSLSVLHFNLAVRSFNVRSLAIEAVVLIGAATILISIVSPLLVGRWIAASETPCSWWVRSCPEELIWEPTWWTQPVGILIGTVLIIGVTLYELRRRPH